MIRVCACYFNYYNFVGKQNRDSEADSDHALGLTHPHDCTSRGVKKPFNNVPKGLCRETDPEPQTCGWAQAPRLRGAGNSATDTCGSTCCKDHPLLKFTPGPHDTPLSPSPPPQNPTPTAWTF